MPESLDQIPEIRALDAPRGLIRIPPETDVPVTERVRSLIDTPPFRRLARISQLGLVSLVYPAAHHSRFEHALGVYRIGLLVLRQLAQDDYFATCIDRHQGERFLATALLHDIGHWPFCHPIEDLKLPDIPRHEFFAAEFIQETDIAKTLRDQWGIEPSEVTTLLQGDRSSEANRILSSLLSGPIDVDKMDYLSRDSLHAGVPYGRNFDQARLIASLCMNASGNSLAIRDKGRTAAEMMVFARYVMFSEVYWHHAVRSATAMLQRAFYSITRQLDLPKLFRLDENHFVAEFRRVAAVHGFDSLLAGLFGPQRQLYKRIAQYNLIENSELYRRLTRRPYPWLVRCSELLSAQLGQRIGRPLRPIDVLIDAPPVQREIEINIDVRSSKEATFRRLTDVSPVVRTLACEQFDDYVKRVRIFVSPAFHPELNALSDLASLVHQVIDVLEREAT